ncbi:flagellin [Ensifer sp. 4252]|uniref:flagellin N-terminal helical domain-containing protein n=1 Tax=Ensifer sp. 4252 TaxID=3373915 RepID=UPI003D25FA3D
MTRILTNVGAISALQTLRSINSDMSMTQGRVSSGFRVQTAADNAAYWSISTTMRSDSKAISAVSDALGLGAAKVDVAYSGMEAVIAVLSEFKAKLVASKEPGVDQEKIQKELDHLKQQIVSITKSSAFNGENWLDVDVDLHTSKTSLVSAFVRKSDGTVSTEMMTALSSEFALFNRTGGAILQARYDVGDPGGNPIRSSLGDVGGLLNSSIMAFAHSSIRYPGVFVTWPVTFSSADSLSFEVTANASIYGPGRTETIVIDQATINATLGRSDGSIDNRNALKSVIDAALQAKSLPIASNAAEYNGTVSLDFISTSSTDVGESIAINNVSSTLAAGFSFGLDYSPIKENNNSYAKEKFNFTGPFMVVDGASFNFDLSAPMIGTNMITYHNYSVTHADVIAALGGSSGVISSSTAFASVLNYVTAGEGLNFTAQGNSIEITPDVAIRPHQGINSWFSIDNVHKVEAGTSPSLPSDDTTTFDFLGIDVTAGVASPDAYIASIEDMLSRSTDAAATLGSLQSRVSLQSDFAQNLMDVIDKGVGRLVDADMNEESTRLKALQTQQQLGIQALQIANSNSENVMALFR